MSANCWRHGGGGGVGGGGATAAAARTSISNGSANGKRPTGSGVPMRRARSRRSSNSSSGGFPRKRIGGRSKPFRSGGSFGLSIDVWSRILLATAVESGERVTWRTACWRGGIEPAYADVGSAITPPRQLVPQIWNASCCAPTRRIPPLDCTRQGFVGSPDAVCAWAQLKAFPRYRAVAVVVADGARPQKSTNRCLLPQHNRHKQGVLLAVRLESASGVQGRHCSVSHSPPQPSAQHVAVAAVGASWPQPCG